MLARTAEGLFWLARYMERADYVARLVQVAQRMSATEQFGESRRGDGSEWHSTIVAAGCEEQFFGKHEIADAATVTHYLVADLENPSSILSCLETARRNARSVRAALTADMWDSINGTWLERDSFALDALDHNSRGKFLDWTKDRSALFIGACTNTMLRNDGYCFLRLGHFLERADNTARILDVKYHVLLPSKESVGGVIDYYQWAAILRVVSALRAYHAIYQGRIEPWKVAELLILKPELPRSLVYCFNKIVSHLDVLNGRGESQRRAGAMHAQLKFGRIDEIFQAGLHEYLTELIEEADNLGLTFSKQYLF